MTDNHRFYGHTDEEIEESIEGHDDQRRRYEGRPSRAQEDDLRRRNTAALTDLIRTALRARR